MAVGFHGYISACVGVVLMGLVVCEKQKFLSQQGASLFLHRYRRANSFWEEGKQGNLERECIEEYCVKEEAREIFENVPETEYFYPRYVDCLGAYRSEVSNFRVALDSEAPSDRRTCIKEISDQCKPLPCNKDGYTACHDGSAKFTCVCRQGWQGERCEEDLNECEDSHNGGCNQTCQNFLGGYRCLCENGYVLHQDEHKCEDINECDTVNDACGTAVCVNTLGSYVCKCDLGYKYNSTTKSCEDINECDQNICSQTCVNTNGSYSCYCDGKVGVKLAEDMKNCEQIPVCLPLNTVKNYELLYLGEQFSGAPVVYLRFWLPGVTRFTAEFDLRTYDPEGVILYTESPDSQSWLLLALRDGKIEIQFKNEYGGKVISSSKMVADGLWHIISVEELEKSITVKIAKEAVMSINNPGRLFPLTNGTLEAKVYIAGLSPKNSILNTINPRLDGCIRGWNLMKQGASGVKEVIHDKESKHCFVTVEKGSYFPGTGAAHFHLDYADDPNSREMWAVNVTMSVRPSTGTGVIFALVQEKSVPLALSIRDSKVRGVQEVIVSVENIVIARLDSHRLCGPRNLLLNLTVTKEYIELTAESFISINYTEGKELEQQLNILHQAVKVKVDTYLGGLPDVPITATPVTAFYNGCMEIEVNGEKLDLDEAVSKENGIRSHSCPHIYQ
ncbi:vitamin K-dependent protein S [Protopterus annectens]|uniref:vitamin K-dependent protein S n=1 Tax=Protopterus annectens TaxID=7888 RepID=UPI001CFAFB35|nr:vitamin K-dependent protein S [Protopterus annectens]